MLKDLLNEKIFQFTWLGGNKTIVPSHCQPEDSLTQSDLQKIQKILREELRLANKMLNSGVEDKTLRAYYKRKKKTLEPLQKKVKVLTGGSWN